MLEAPQPLGSFLPERERGDPAAGQVSYELSLKGPNFLFGTNSLGILRLRLAQERAKLRSE
jgi:hypothetical protein